MKNQFEFTLQEAVDRFCGFSFTRYCGDTVVEKLHILLLCCRVFIHSFHFIYYVKMLLFINGEKV